MVNDVTFFQFTGHILHRDAGADHQHQHLVGKIADLVNGLFLILFFARKMCIRDSVNTYSLA